MSYLFPLLLLFVALPAAADEWADVSAELQRFAEAYAVVEQEAAEPVDPFTAVYRGAIPGMLKRLDPHSVFFDPIQFEQLNEMQNSTRKGFGSVVSVLPGRVIVLQTLPETPAARAGMAPGDEILAINGIRLDRLSLDQLVGLLGKSRRSEVKLDIRRAGSSRLLEFTMVPAELQTPSVDLKFFLRAGVGYVRVKSFEGKTAELLREAIDGLGGDDLRALVLDLRDNPGGVMPAALQTAALFLEPNQVLVSVRGRGTTKEEITVPEGMTAYRFPLAILVNDRSASSSEIVAGAMQDHDRAILVGTTTFGKGLVQSVFTLSERTALALTTAYYYTPSGRSIQRPLEGGQLQTAVNTGEGREAYETESGRPLKGNGGIHPDHVVYQTPLTRLRIVIEATASLTSFATETLRKVGPISPDYEVSDSLMDEFQVYLAERSIQPSIGQWSSDREWIRSRLRQEIFNQALGVAAGDEVEMLRDPQVRAALTALGIE